MELDGLGVRRGLQSAPGEKWADHIAGVTVDVGAVAVVTLEVEMEFGRIGRLGCRDGGDDERDDERRCVIAVPAGWHGGPASVFLVPACLLAAVS